MIDFNSFILGTQSHYYFHSFIFSQLIPASGPLENQSQSLVAENPRLTAQRDRQETKSWILCLEHHLLTFIWIALSIIFYLVAFLEFDLSELCLKIQSVLLVASLKLVNCLCHKSSKLSVRVACTWWSISWSLGSSRLEGSVPSLCCKVVMSQYCLFQIISSSMFER